MNIPNKNISEKLTDDEIDFIKSLSNEMKTQDNRCTAQPYGLILTQEVEEVRPSGFGDSYVARFNDESYYDFDELKQALYEHYGNNNIYVKLIQDEEYDSFSSFIDTYEANGLDVDIYAYETTQVPKKMSSNFFITEKAYHDYIRRDGHNLTKPQSFGIHLTRNSEMEKLYKILHKLADILEEVK